MPLLNLSGLESNNQALSALLLSSLQKRLTSKNLLILKNEIMGIKIKEEACTIILKSSSGISEARLFSEEILTCLNETLEQSHIKKIFLRCNFRLGNGS